MTDRTAPSLTDPRLPAATQTQAVLDFLTQQGLCPEVDDDGDVRFKFEGWTYWVMSPDTDPTCLTLTHPNFWFLGSEGEHHRALEVAARVQWRFRVGRLTTTEKNVWASVEAYLPDDRSFEQVLLRNLGALQAIVSEFCDEMHAETRN